MSNTATLNHKEMTAHIRRRISVAGIKASVRKYTSCGANFIHISTLAYDSEFTPCEQNAIKMTPTETKTI